MDIISRNFFRLLCAGAFNEEVQIEPMSAWKWRRVYQYSLMHGVSALLYDGIGKCRQQFFLQLPPDLEEIWKNTTEDIERENKHKLSVFLQLHDILNKQQLRPILMKGFQLASLYDRPEHRLSQSIKIYFPFETQGKKADKWATENGNHLNDSDRLILRYEWNDTHIEHHHSLHLLTNKFLNNSLQSIIEKEIRENKAAILINGKSIEVTSNTLICLQVILSIARHMLNNGISMKQLVDLGIVLRKAGDKIDYVALQGWIDKLSLKRIAQISGTLLIELFHFTEDEIPFTTLGKKIDTKHVFNELFKLESTPPSDWYFQQGKEIFVHATNSSAMMWHVRHSARYFKYYPSESITNFFTSFTHSLSHIEE